MKTILAALASLAVLAPVLATGARAQTVPGVCAARGAGIECTANLPQGPSRPYTIQLNVVRTGGTAPGLTLWPVAEVGPCGQQGPRTTLSSLSPGGHTQIGTLPAAGGACFRLTIRCTAGGNPADCNGPAGVPTPSVTLIRR